MMQHRSHRALLALALVGVVHAASAATEALHPPAPAEAAAERLYRQHCAACHEGQVPKAPHRTMLGIMSAQSIERALTTGVMQQEAAALDGDQRRILAAHLAGTEAAGDRAAIAPACSGDRHDDFDTGRPPLGSGWGLTPANERVVSTTAAGIAPEDLERLELKWALAFPDALRARSQPMLAGGRLFVGSHNGEVHALDPETGCLHWSFAASAEVRTGIVVDPWDAAADPADVEPRAYFGDLLGNVYAVDARSGELVWRARADAHPNATITGTPSLHDGSLYVPVSSLEVVPAADPAYECCTFRGSVVAYDAATGEQRWQAYTLPEATEQEPNRAGTRQFGPSGAPIWNSPAIDTERGQLYVGTGENYSSPASDTSDAIFAIGLAEGDVRWVYQATPNDAWNTACDQEDDHNCPEEDGPDFDFGAATLLARTADDRALVIGGQKSGEVHALDPDTGELVWRSKIGRGGIQGGVHFGMAAHGGKLYVPINDMPDGRRYPEPRRPGLYQLDLADGYVDWQQPAPRDTCRGRRFCDHGLSAAITATPELVFAGGLDGVLRIHDAASGEVLWTFDTTEEFETVGGTTSRGGSMSGGGGPVPADGMLFVNSGYGIYQHMPGNVLLAFGPGEGEPSVPAAGADERAPSPEGDERPDDDEIEARGATEGPGEGTGR